MKTRHEQVCEAINKYVTSENQEKFENEILHTDKEECARQVCLAAMDCSWEDGFAQGECRGKRRGIRQATLVMSLGLIIGGLIADALKK